VNNAWLRKGRRSRGPQAQESAGGVACTVPGEKVGLGYQLERKTVKRRNKGTENSLFRERKNPSTSKKGASNQEEKIHIKGKKWSREIFTPWKCRNKSRPGVLRACVKKIITAWPRKERWPEVFPGKKGRPVQTFGPEGIRRGKIETDLPRKQTAAVPPVQREVPASSTARKKHVVKKKPDVDLQKRKTRETLCGGQTKRGPGDTPSSPTKGMGKSPLPHENQGVVAKNVRNEPTKEGRELFS